MRGDEIDGGIWPAAGQRVEVATSSETVGEFGERLARAPPVVAHDVAVLAVPLRPERREVADLIAALADIPRLGDELDLGDDRILLDDVEEGTEAVDVVQLPGERGRKVEAEAVHVHLQHPVAQRVHDELQHVRVAHVQAVARAGVVHVVLTLTIDEAIVGGVVDALHR